VGRIAAASGTTSVREFRKRDAMLTWLAEHGRLDLLRAVRDRTVSVTEVYDAYRANNLDTLVGERAILAKPLWDTVDAWADSQSSAKPTRTRYQNSFNALRRSGVLATSASVADLARVDWKELAAEWPKSGSDFNHLRRAVSKFLTDMLGDVYHPFRRSVVRLIPKRPERKRVPDLTPAVFWEVTGHAPEWAQPIFVTLVATGMRIGEYLRCTDVHLLPHTHSIAVPGTKTAGSADVIEVDEAVWPWITRAIPCSLGDPPDEWRGVQRDSRYKLIRREWLKACTAEGVREARLHDLRHSTAQWLTASGVSEARVQVMLRHASASMTRRYAMQRDRGETARVMGDVLLRRGA
jgi:integrase